MGRFEDGGAYKGSACKKIIDGNKKDKLVWVDETHQIGSGKENKKRRANCYIKLGTLVCNVIRMV